MSRRRSRSSGSGHIQATVVGKNAGSAANLASFGRRKKRGPKGTIDPPFDPDTLYTLYENSSILRPNIEAYVTNIDSFGHHFVPALDLTASEADTRIRDAVQYERFLDASDRGDIVNPMQMEEPTDDDVLARKAHLKKTARFEFARVRSFFKFACPDMSFVELRRRTRQDLEVTGNGYWEILRNKLGEISRLVYVRTNAIRITGTDDRHTTIRDKVKVTDISVRPRQRRVKFRRFVQIDKNGKDKAVYFKTFGDPRIISRDTGVAYVSLANMLDKEPDARVATEILHFQLHSPTSVYGIPRWTPNLPAVLGSRELDEVNLNYFKNNVVPPLALLVSGGRFSKGVASRIEQFIDEHLKGKKGLHRILVLEAEGQKASGDTGPKLVPRIQFVPLRDVQQQDALFQEYDKRNEEKVAKSFRIPRFLRGDDTHTNRACYSSDTEVLTDRGWLLHDEVEPGDKIAVYDRETRVMRFEEPRGLYEAPYKGSMVHFTNKQVDILVTPDHKMLFNGPWQKDDTWRVAYASEIHLNRYVFPATPTLTENLWQPPEYFELPKATKCSRGHKKSHEKIAWSTWLEFVGLFCSDGGLLNSTAAISRNDYRVFLRAKKGFGQERVRSCIAKLGWHYTENTKKDGTLVICFHHRCLWTYMKEHFGTYQVDRRLPENYVLQPQKQLQQLIDPLMVGDGHDTESGREYKVYYSKSTQLVDQVQTILLQLGWRVSIRPGERCWRVTHSRAATTEIQSKQDVEKVNYDGMVYCFVTSTGFYVTRRNGKIAIQGNTAFANLRFAEEQVFNPERELFDSIINRKLLPELGITFWEFNSNAPITRDPETMTKMVIEFVKQGILTPAEGRELASDVFNKAFVEISEEWTNKPLPFVLAQLRGTNADIGSITAPSDTLTNSPDDDAAPRTTSPATPPSMRRAGTPLEPIGGDVSNDDQVQTTR